MASNSRCFGLMDWVSKHGRNCPVMRAWQGTIPIGGREKYRLQHNHIYPRHDSGGMHVGANRTSKGS